jgi:hypothetical protein
VTKLNNVKVKAMFRVIRQARMLRDKIDQGHVAIAAERLAEGGDRTSTSQIIAVPDAQLARLDKALRHFDRMIEYVREDRDHGDAAKG